MPSALRADAVAGDRQMAWAAQDRVLAVGRRVLQQPGFSSLRASSLSASWASSRASGAPKQPWMPLPKPRCSMFSRSGSNRSGSLKRSGSRFPAASTSHSDAPLGMVTPRTSMSASVVRCGTSCTGGSKRSSSSTMGTASLGSSRSRPRTSGLRSRVSMPLVMRLTVVSWPAISRSAAVLSTSIVVIAPSGPCAVASSDSMSSPGFLRRSSMSPARYMPSSVRALCETLACSSGSASGSGSRLAAMMSAQVWKRDSSSRGTPSSRQITVTGKGYENWSTRSIRSGVSIPSMSPVTMSRRSPCMS